MSAIWGQVSFEGNVYDQITVMKEPYQRKCRLDRIEQYKRPDCYMGCGIQYIKGESVLEQLPYADEENGTDITADCILDNRRELLQKLELSDSGMPDGDIIRAAYRKWGISCVRQLRGQFSIAIWNRRKKELYLIADPVSSRCLYYYRAHNTVLFSTLMEPIRLAVPSIAYNERYLKDYAAAPGLMPNIISSETPYKDICKCNPGTWLRITKDEVCENTYWEPANTENTSRCHGADEYIRAFYELYRECVKDTLRSSGNIGIAMSSGLDSASIGVLAARLLEKERKNLYTYTYVPYENEAHTAKNLVINEESDVRRIASQYPNMKLTFLNNSGKNCYEDLDHWLDVMEMPYKAYVNIPSLGEIYEKGAGDGCKVILTGQMGNATVSNGYIDDVLYDLYRNRRYVTLLRNLNHYCRHVKESRKSALGACLRYFQYADRVVRSSEWTYKPDNPFLNQEIFKDYSVIERLRESGVEYMEKLPLYQETHRSFLGRKAMYTYIGEYETKLGLAGGVVLRDPTRDVRMLQFCYHLPYELYAHGGTPRWLIREAFRDMLPHELLDDWMRYGVQNNDWFFRVKRDWATIGAVVMTDLENARKAGYAVADIDSVRRENSMDEELQMMYLMYLSVLGRFLNNI